MISGQTILCFASGYDAPPTSKHHIMHLLAEHNVVLWVNYHASRKVTTRSSDFHRSARKLQQVFKGLQQRRKNLHVLTPLVIPLPASPLARRINRTLLFRQIRCALNRVQKGKLQLWSFTPDISYMLGRFQERRVVYYCVDDFACFTGYNRAQVLADEADLCHRADLVVTTSLALQRGKQALNPRTLLVPHGVDYEHFSQALRTCEPPPEELADIPHPRLGFFGLIRDWVNLDLVAAVARQRPEWHFIFIGDSDVDLTAYRRIHNLHFLGSQQYSRLPVYCREFDAALIPFKINELTAAVNPIKLREYLAAGLPVISTPLPEVELYRHLVHIADTPEAFAQAIEKALAGNASDRLSRNKAMLSETWPSKLDFIDRALQAIEQPSKAVSTCPLP